MAIQQGDKIHRWTVLKPAAEVQGRGNNMALCRCECGTEKLVRHGHLGSGQTKSCGCYNKEVIRRIKTPIGAKRGRWTVEFDAGRIGGIAHVQARCECGTIRIATVESLHGGGCGCGSKARGIQQRRDLTGQQFGRLTARRVAEQHVRGRLAWECDCICGKSTVVTSTDLTQGNTSSCGCGSSRLTFKHGLAHTPAMKRFYSMKRIAAKKCRTPKWANLNAIKEIYLNCPEGYEVDHVIPLQGKLVSGFHVESNLQYLTKQENWSKKHKFEPQFISR